VDKTERKSRSPNRAFPKWMGLFKVNVRSTIENEWELPDIEQGSEGERRTT
jgi:hypothetical protein